MDKKEKVVEQTTFNEDEIAILVEDGIVENLEEVVENANEDK